MGHVMDRTVLVGALVTVAVAYGASIALEKRTADTPPNAASHRSAIHKERSAPQSAPEQHTAPATEASIDAALQAQVEHKYRFLFAEVDGEHVDELKRRLLERESEANLVARDRMDADLSHLLPADRFAYYQALKDSDLEQHHLAEYTGGISNVAPLDERQERAVLDAKLRQKQRYASVIRDVGLERDALAVEERNYAKNKSAEALKQFMEDFLTEVAPSLTAEQYTQLKNYETTEFARELNRLQQRINAK
jgi:hypothetical protein